MSEDNEQSLYSVGLLTNDGPGTPMREITAEEWSTPVYFPAEAKSAHHNWDDAAHSSFSLCGWIPSLYIGTHVGWKVDGQQYSRETFEEHRFDGCFTGGTPVGLAWKVPPQ